MSRANAPRSNGHGANADILTKGSLQAHDPYDYRSNKMPTAEYDGPDAADGRSNTFSVELDEEGSAPAPPHVRRNQAPSNNTS